MENGFWGMYLQQWDPLIMLIGESFKFDKVLHLLVFDPVAHDSLNLTLFLPVLIFFTPLLSAFHMRVCVLELLVGLFLCFLTNPRLEV